jgi:2-methylisocitrate lyase-like PEP mutase family enzyme
MRASTALRGLMRQQSCLVVPGCFNALSARVLQKAGFEAIYMTGYGTSLSLLGMPDAGFATMSEMHLNARYIANAVPGIPVIADADNGYGNAVQMTRAVREYIQTGVAGVHIEDQVAPKRCGHVAGKFVIPLEEAVGKVRAAHDVRQALDPDFLLIARSDARGANGGSLEEAIDRVNAYLEAGADMGFVEGPSSVAEVEQVCAQVRGPVFYNQTGVSPKFSLDQLRSLGVALAIVPNALTRCAVTSMYDLATRLREDPLNEVEFMDSIRDHPCGDMHEFAGFAEVREVEERYLPKEELRAKYEGADHGWRAGSRDAT